MIDLHCHLIPGVDDGPGTREDALGLARAMSAEGVRIAAATSHVNARHPNTAAGLAEGLARLRAALDEEGVELDVVAGAEIEASSCAGFTDAQLAGLALGGGRWLLLETPYTSHPTILVDIVLGLRVRGFEVLIAHPERNPHVRGDPRTIAAVIDAGACVQVNADSLLGGGGRAVQASAWRLLEGGMAHLVAGDAHSTGSRPPLLAAARDKLAGRLGAEAGNALTEGIPAAILASADPSEIDEMRDEVVRWPSRGRRLMRRWARR